MPTKKMKKRAEEPKQKREREKERRDNATIFFHTCASQ